MKFNGMTFGVPREIMAGERRVAMIPETVRKFTEAGARVLVEVGAAQGSFYSDEAFAEAGAEMVSSPEEVYGRADIILKVKEPKFNDSLNKHEAELLPEGSTLVCFLHPANPLNHEMIKTLARRNITSFTLDGIPRISRAQQMDALTSMSTVAGYKAVITASNHLPRFIPMMPTAAGIIQPAQILVLGIGVAGLQAVATAKRLGAKVKALDIRPEANEQARSLGAEIIPFTLPDGVGVGKGGYACRLPDEWYAREKEVIAPHVQGSDVVILTALVQGEKAPVLIDKEMIKPMRSGSVIVDISIDQGGNCELTEVGVDLNYEGVIISGLANIPATLAADSTKMFAQNVWHYLNHIVKDGQVGADEQDQIIQESLVTKDTKIVHQGTLMAMC